MTRAKKKRKIWFYLFKAHGFDYHSARHHTNNMSENEFEHTLQRAIQWMQKNTFTA